MFESLSVCLKICLFVSKFVCLFEICMFVCKFVCLLKSLSVFLESLSVFCSLERVHPT